MLNYILSAELWGFDDVKFYTILILGFVLIAIFIKFAIKEKHRLNNEVKMRDNFDDENPFDDDIEFGENFSNKRNDLFCPYCGARIRGVANFCQNCGERLGEGSFKEEPIYEADAVKGGARYKGVKNEGEKESVGAILALVFSFIFPLVGLILSKVMLSSCENEKDRKLLRIAKVISTIFVSMVIALIVLYVATIASIVS